MSRIEKQKLKKKNNRKKKRQITAKERDELKEENKRLRAQVIDLQHQQFHHVSQVEEVAQQYSRKIRGMEFHNGQLMREKRKANELIEQRDQVISKQQEAIVTQRKELQLITQRHHETQIQYNQLSSQLLHELGVIGQLKESD